MSARRASGAATLSAQGPPSPQAPTWWRMTSLSCPCPAGSPRCSSPRPSGSWSAPGHHEDRINLTGTACSSSTPPSPGQSTAPTPSASQPATCQPGRPPAQTCLARAPRHPRCGHSRPRTGHGRQWSGRTGNRTLLVPRPATFARWTISAGRRNSAPNAGSGRPAGALFTRDIAREERPAPPIYQNHAMKDFGVCRFQSHAGESEHEPGIGCGHPVVGRRG